MNVGHQLTKMQADWDRRARENARHFIANSRENWDDNDFYASGDQTIADQILNDMGNVCQGKSPAEMRVLEIGCGAGRITRALAKVFGEVHGVDISGEMIARAREALQDVPNASVYQNNGMDLRVVPPVPFDFAFSIYVFQHIPSYEIIDSYLRETARLLAPGALLKFQAQGCSKVMAAEDDTWVGVPLSVERARGMAERTGFECRYTRNAEMEEFWLWFFRRADPAESLR